MNFKKKRTKKKKNKKDFLSLIIFIIYILLMLLETNFIYGKQALIFSIIKTITLIICFILIINHFYKTKKMQYFNVIISVVLLMTIMLSSFKSINCMLSLFNDSKTLITSDYIVDCELNKKYLKYYTLELNDIDETVRISNNWYNKLKNKDTEIKVIYWKNTGIIDVLELIEPKKEEIIVNE